MQTTSTSETQALALFFEKVKTMGFVSRVFNWKPFRALSFEAYDQYQSLKQMQTQHEHTQQALHRAESVISTHRAETIEIKEKLEQKQAYLEERKTEIVRLQEHQKQMQDKLIFEKEQLAVAQQTASMQSKRLETLEKELSNLKVIEQKDREAQKAKQLELVKLQGELKQAQEHLEDRSNLVSTLSEKVSHHEQRLLETAAEKAAFAGQIEQLQTDLQKKEQEVGKTSTTAEKNQERIQQLEKEKLLLDQQLQTSRQQLNQAKEKLVQYEERAEEQQRQFDYRVSQVNAIKTQLDQETQRMRDARENEMLAQIEALKNVWQSHEETVERRIQDICNRYNIEYVDREKVPFRGKPDNTLRIANEFLIFDAKAPTSEDLKTFGAYIRKSAEQLKKYAHHDGVKKDLFLVIPHNASAHIKETYLNMTDYRVFVVTPDALEPIILSLLKIEEYEFAEQLSPEEREQIGRIIGKFAHAAKRKIQIDTYLNNNFLSILEQCDRLPENLLQEAVSFEKSDKLNPPMEKRVKVISMKETHKSVKKLQANAQAENIPVGAVLASIDQIPLEHP